MFNRYLTYYNPWVQILVFCILFLLCLLFNAFLDATLAPLLSGGLEISDLSEAENLKNPNALRALKYLQMISQFFIFLVPSGLFAYLAYPKPIQYLHLNAPAKKVHWFYAVLLMLCTIPFIAFLEYLNKKVPLPPAFMEVEKMASEITDAFLGDRSIWGSFLNIFMFVALAAVGEELFFRGILQNILVSHWYKKTPLLGIVITAILFSLFHGQMHGFLPRFFAGVAIGCAYFYSGSLWIAIIMHALNNGLSILAYYSEKQGGFSEADMNQLILAIFGLGCFAMLYIFYRQKTDYVVYKVDQDPDDEHNLMANKY